MPSSAPSPGRAHVPQLEDDVSLDVRPCARCSRPRTARRAARRTSATGRASSPNMIRTICGAQLLVILDRECPAIERPASRPWRRIEIAVARAAERLVELVRDEDRPPGPAPSGARSTLVSSATPWGVSIEVGSSRISTRDPRQSALMISTCCWWPRARSTALAVRVDLDAEQLGELGAGALVRPPRPAAAVRSRRASGSRAR